MSFFLSHLFPMWSALPTMPALQHVDTQAPKFAVLSHFYLSTSPCCELCWCVVFTAFVYLLQLEQEPWKGSVCFHHGCVPHGQRMPGPGSFSVNRSSINGWMDLTLCIWGMLTTLDLIVIQIRGLVAFCGLSHFWSTGGSIDVRTLIFLYDYLT